MPTPRLTGHKRANIAAAMRREYENGRTIRQIAYDHGRSYGGTHRLLLEAGTTLRQRHGAPIGGNAAAATLAWDKPVAK